MNPIRHWVVFVCLLFAAAASAVASQPESPEVARYIVTIASPAADVENVAYALSSEYGGTVLAVWQHAVRGFWIELSPADAARLADDERVATLERDSPVSFSGSGSEQTGPAPDPLWHLTRISHRAIQDGMTAGTSDFIYRYPHDGAGVRVYLIDTGVRKSHAALTNANVEQGKSIVAVQNDLDVTERTGDSVPIDTSTADAPCNGGPIVRDASHGTSTASLVVGSRSGTLPQVGVAPGATLVPVMISSCTGPVGLETSNAALISAFDWIKTDMSTRNVPAVISISAFSVTEKRCNKSPDVTCIVKPELDALEAAISGVIDAGIPVIASANNFNDDACHTVPARFSRRGGFGKVLTVGASNSQDKRLSSSNYGPCVDIFAPGENVRVALPFEIILNDDGQIESYRHDDQWFVSNSGTSYAAPIVAGLVARMMSEDTLLTSIPKATVADRVWERLKANAGHLTSDMGVGSPSLLAYLGGVTFTSQPEAVRRMISGEPITLAVSVVDSNSVTYQWYQGVPGNVEASEPATPTPLNGTSTTSATYTFVPEAKTYWVRVTRGSYTADSRGTTVSLETCRLPEIAKHPAIINADKFASPVEVEASVRGTGGTIETMFLYRWERWREHFSIKEFTKLPSPHGDDQPFTVTAELPLPRLPVTSSSFDPIDYKNAFPFRLVLTCAGANPLYSDTFQVRTRDCASPTVTPVVTSGTIGGHIRLETDGPGVGARLFWYRDDVPLRVDLPGAESQTVGRKWLTFHDKFLYPPQPGKYQVRIGDLCGQSALSAPVNVTSTCNWRTQLDTDGGAPTYVDATTVTSIAAVPNSVLRISARALLELDRLDFDPIEATKPNYDRTAPPGATFIWTINGVTTVGDSVDIPVNNAVVNIALEAKGRSVTRNDVEEFGCTRNYNFTIVPIPPQCFSLEGKGPGDIAFRSAAEIEVRVYSYSPNAVLEVRAPAGTYTYEWKQDTRVVSTDSSLSLDDPDLTLTDGSKLQVNVTEPATGCQRSVTFTVKKTCEDFLVLAGRCQLVANPQVLVRPDSTIFLHGRVTDHDGAQIDDATTNYEWYEVRGGNRAAEPFHHGPGAAGAEARYKVTGAAQYSIDLFVTHDGCTTAKSIPVKPQGTSIGDYTPLCGRYRPMRYRLGDEPEPISLLEYTQGEIVTLGVEIERPGYSYEWYRRADGAEAQIGTGATVTMQVDAPATYWYIEANSLELIASDEVTARLLDGSASAGTRVIPATQAVSAGNNALITAELDSSARVENDELRYNWRRGSLYDDTRPVIPGGQTLTATNLFDDTDFWCRIEQYVGETLIDTYDTPFASVFVRCTPTVHGLMDAQPQFIGAGDTSLIVPSVHGKLPYLDWWTLADDGVTRIPYGSGEMRAINIRPSVAMTRIGATATDACGAVGTVDPATVYVCVPAIVPPQSMTLVGENGRADLSVAVTPALPSQTVDIQWYDDEDQTRANSLGSGLSFQTPAVPPGATKSYVAKITAQCTSDRQYVKESAVAVVHACANPAIVTQPSDVWSTNPGSPAGLSLYANGTDLTYQWYEGERGDTSKPWQNRTERDATFYPNQTTTYWCRITSEGLCVIDSESATIHVCSSPAITAQPQTTRVFPNGTATLSVAIDAGTNTEPLTYQWQQQNAGGSWLDIPGATEPMFTTPAFEGTLQEANYRVIVKAGLCPTESDVATVSLCTYPPVVPGQDQNTRYGESVFVSLPALSPVEDKTITWYRGQSGDDSQPMRTAYGANLLNETGPVTDTSYFWAEFEHMGCVSRTETYTIRACIAEITTQPTGTMVPAGTATTLAVGTTPIANQSYQWYIGAPPSMTSPVAAGTTASIQVAPTEATTYWCRVTSPCGKTADSDAVTVTTCTPAEIQNIFVTPSYPVPSGTTVELRINSSGLNQTYQWYQGAKGVTTNPVTNGTSGTLLRTITATTSYWCRVTTDGVCQKDSDAVTITVCTNPTITTEPVSQFLFPEASGATLSVAASPLPVTYQWYTGTSGDTAAPIAGATSSSVTVQPAATTNYWVRVSNGGCKDDSVTATVTKCVLPQEVTAKQPTSNVAYNEIITLSLPTMSPAVDKQVTWYRAAVGVKTNQVASGINASYTAAHVASASYWAEFSHNGCVSRTTAYVVNVCKPTITAQPQNALIEAGQSTTLSVTASGEALTYQWYKGASGDTTSPVSGGTSPTLSVSPASDTTYWVRVTGCTTANSTAATVTVCITPTVSSPTKGADGRAGDAAFVSVTATGPALTYQWYKGPSGDTSSPISGATSARYDFTLTSTAYYWVRVTSTCTGGGTRSTNSAAVLYSVLPTISKNPANTAIPSGGRTLLKVTAAGTYLTYQWYETTGYSSTLIPGETASTFFTPAASTTKKYWVKVTSGALFINSSVAQVDICTGPIVESFNSSGSGDDFTFTVNVDVEQEDLVTYYWYRGTPGRPHESTFLGEGIYRRSFTNITPLPATFWVRVYWNDLSCYTDTAGKTVP